MIKMMERYAMGVDMNAREIALMMLIDILEEKKLSHYVLKDGLAKNVELVKQDRAFVSRLVIGCIERQITLDYDINRFSKIKVSKMKPIIRNILRIGVYQLKYMDQIPDSAICNEAVKLAKKRGFVGLSGFVNGILRSMVRQRDLLLKKPDNFTENDELIYDYSVPEWLVTFFIDRFGIDITKEIFQAYELKKETTIRINTTLITKEEVKRLLTKEKVNVSEGRILPLALRISEYDSLDRLESFNSGFYQIQDESSMLVGEIAGVKPNDVVIDVCAAPGGKALHIAQLLGGTGKVLACDKTQMKIDLINQNISRLKLTNISTEIADALCLNTNWIETADLVIADLPCSGLGVIGKKPDIKYNMNLSTMKELAQLQKDILKVVSRYVKPQKTLIYSTCTINPQENEENVNYLVQELGFELEDIEPYLCEKLHQASTKKGYLQVLPQEWNTDGFFIARLRKR
jgi:16S rRNA (cytosine967-C5)-methyltransferase